MKKNDRKKEIVKGLLMVAFAFAVVLIRCWLFPDNEVLKHIALIIGFVLANNGSRLVLNMNEKKPENSQEKETQQADQYEPVPARNYLVMAGIMVGVSAFCFWASEWPMKIPEFSSLFAFLGILSIMTAVLSMFMALGRIKVGAADNENITPAEAEKDVDSDISEDENEDEKSAVLV